MNWVKGLLGPLGCVLLVSACASTPSSSGTGLADSVDPHSGSVSCNSLFSTILSRERRGDTAGEINAELDALGDRCPDAYQVFVDYHSIKAFAGAGAGGTCAEYVNYRVQPEAIELARQDGLCSGSGSAGRPAGTAEWACVYSPTYNDDWHDDVMCSNGVDQERPYLREWDNFVTEAEIMESAREYEQRLNRH